MPRSLVAALAAVALALVACAHTPASRHSPSHARDLATVTPVAPSTLAAGLVIRGADAPRVRDPFDRCPSPRCGTAGVTAAITLTPRHEQVVSLLERYAHAINERSNEALRGVFDDLVVNANNPRARESAGWSREHVVAMHARLIEALDARGFEAQLLRVASYEECRRQPCRAEMQPGDWFAEWRPLTVRTTPMANTPSTPIVMVVRWRDEAPRIAALNQEFFSTR